MDAQKQEFTILDHVDQICVPGDVFREPANEFWSLLCLWTGLEYLSHQASKCDVAAAQILNPGGKLKMFASGNMPGLESIPRPLLTCSYDWYAITAFNYAMVVGAIAYRQESSRPKPREYVEKAMPEILSYRDKVAAHRAWSTKNSKDNEAERFESIIPQLTFENDRFVVGGLTISLCKGGKRSSSEAIQPWSITRVHERLRQRYWPQSNPSEAKQDGTAH